MYPQPSAPDMSQMYPPPYGASNPAAGGQGYTRPGQPVAFGSMPLRLSLFDRTSYVVHSLFFVACVIATATADDNDSKVAGISIKARLLLLLLGPANIMSASTTLRSRQIYFDIAFATAALNAVFMTFSIMAILFFPKISLVSLSFFGDSIFGSLYLWTCIWYLSLLHILSLFASLRSLREKWESPSSGLWVLCVCQAFVYGYVLDACARTDCLWLLKLAVLGLLFVNANCFLLNLDKVCVYGNIALPVIALLASLKVLPNVGNIAQVFHNTGVLLWMGSLLVWLLAARYGHLISTSFEPPAGARLGVRKSD